MCMSLLPFRGLATASPSFIMANKICMYVFILDPVGRVAVLVVHLFYLFDCV